MKILRLHPIIFRTISSVALLMLSISVLRLVIRQNDITNQLVSRNNAAVDIVLFGPTKPAAVTFNSFDGEIIWIKNELPRGLVRSGGGQNFLEISRVGIGSSGGPDILEVPSGADGYIKKTFRAPFNQ